MRSGNHVAYQLNEVFRSNLQKALFGGGETWTTAKEQLGVDKHQKSIEELDTYSKERWDGLLSYLTTQNGRVSPDIIALLKHSNLCDANGETRFQFLLLDRSSQGMDLSRFLSLKRYYRVVRSHKNYFLQKVSLKFAAQINIFRTVKNPVWKMVENLRLSFCIK